MEYNKETGHILTQGAYTLSVDDLDDVGLFITNTATNELDPLEGKCYKVTNDLTEVVELETVSFIEAAGYLSAANKVAVEVSKEQKRQAGLVQPILSAVTKEGSIN